MPHELWREAVGRVAAEVPGTFLLAEAFWLMESYFVRTPGMHRVYNSAVVNMMRDEDNARSPGAQEHAGVRPGHYEALHELHDEGHRERTNEFFVIGSGLTLTFLRDPDDLIIATHSLESGGHRCTSRRPARGCAARSPLKHKRGRAAEPGDLAFMARPDHGRTAGQREDSRIKKLDWVAIPLLPYLYAVDQIQDVPAWVEADSVKKMRERYAEAHLAALVSDVDRYDSKNVWPQLLGVAYIRKIYSFEIITTDEQDDRLVEEYNDRANSSHFNLFTNNCADFSRRVLNLYNPHAVGRNIVADLAIATPKQIAKALVT